MLPFNFVSTKNGFPGPLKIDSKVKLNSTFNPSSIVTINLFFFLSWLICTIFVPNLHSQNAGDFLGIRLKNIWKGMVTLKTHFTMSVGSSDFGLSRQSCPMISDPVWLNSRFKILSILLSNVSIRTGEFSFCPYKKFHKKSKNSGRELKMQAKC